MVHTHIDEHAAVLLHASQHPYITHTHNDGASNHQSVGGVDGPEGRDEVGKPGVHGLEYPKPEHKATTQLQQTPNRKNSIILGI